ncbi:MAG: c-type cytochrome domain-containing protein [Gallionella sp.]
MKNTTFQGLIVLASLLFSGVAMSATPHATISYQNDVRPILHDYCLSCHQPDGKGYKKSGLDMRTYASLMKGTHFGSVIKPGDSFTSIFIQVIEGRVHSAIKMPYGMAGGLAKSKIAVLKHWVDQGAKDN